MCDSENPYKDSNEVRWLCSVCTYANKEGATECSMCGVKLHVLMHSPIGSRTSPTSTTSFFDRDVEYASSTKGGRFRDLDRYRQFGVVVLK